VCCPGDGADRYPPRHGRLTSLLGSRTFLGTIVRRRRTCASSTPMGPPGLGSSSLA
jgi:hypothetical protein